MKQSKGFTLIELLVVIAIIGILSSIVLASLNTARERGADAAVKANLSGMRAQAEIFYDDNPTYEGVCANMAAAGDAAAAATGATFTATDATDATGEVATCHDLEEGWAAVAPLSNDTGWCVDSTGASVAVAITVLDVDDTIACS